MRYWAGEVGDHDHHELELFSLIAAVTLCGTGTGDRRQARLVLKTRLWLSCVSIGLGFYRPYTGVGASFVITQSFM